MNRYAVSHRVKCDAIGCGYIVAGIADVEAMKAYVDRPCPNCGANLCTQRDYADYVALVAHQERMLSLLGTQRVSPEELNPTGEPTQQITLQMHEGKVTVEGSTRMNFGDALQALKNGAKITRSGWNGKGMFVYYVPGGQYRTQTDAAKSTFGESATYEPYIAMKTVQGTVVPWLASHSDLFADDWSIVK